jgi:hypothetical protein
MKSALTYFLKGAFGFFFWFHLFITLLSWVAPFLYSWYYLLPVYWTVMLQFAIFNRCLMNKEHDLGEDDDMTFYSHILELVGFKFKRSNVKIFCRRILYPFLTAVTLIWQVVLGNAPTVF